MSERLKNRLRRLQPARPTYGRYDAARQRHWARWILLTCSGEAGEAMDFFCPESADRRQEILAEAQSLLVNDNPSRWAEDNSLIERFEGGRCKSRSAGIWGSSPAQMRNHDHAWMLAESGEPRVMPSQIEALAAT